MWRHTRNRDLKEEHRPDKIRERIAAALAYAVGALLHSLFGAAPA